MQQAAQLLRTEAIERAPSCHARDIILPTVIRKRCGAGQAHFSADTAAFSCTGF